MATKKTSLGFSLLELMIVALLIGIAAVWVGPNLASSNQNKRITNAAREFNSMLSFARNEAIRLNAIVHVETQQALNDDFGGELWICAVDNNFGTDCDNPAASMLKVVDISKSNVNIRTSNQADNKISFDPRGRLTDGPGNPPAGTFDIAVCDGRNDVGVATRKIIRINGTGRAILQDFDWDNDLCDPI